MKKTFNIRLKESLIPLVRGLSYYDRKSISSIIEEALMLLLEERERKGERVIPYYGQLTPGVRVKLDNDFE